MTKQAQLIDMLEEWLAFAEDKFSECDVEGDDCDPDDGLCPQCESNGCIQYKIRRTRALIDRTAPPESP